MLWIGKFFKENKQPQKSAEETPKPKQPTKEYKNDTARFLAFILNEDKEDKIILGKRQDRYFVCFKNEYLQPFFSDWFVLMKGLVNKELSADTYEACLKTLFEKYSDEKEKKDSIPKEAPAATAAEIPMPMDTSAPTAGSEIPGGTATIAILEKIIENAVEIWYYIFNTRE